MDEVLDERSPAGWRPRRIPLLSRPLSTAGEYGPPGHEARFSQQTLARTTRDELLGDRTSTSERKMGMPTLKSMGTTTSDPGRIRTPQPQNSSGADEGAVGVLAMRWGCAPRCATWPCRPARLFAMARIRCRHSFQSQFHYDCLLPSVFPTNRLSLAAAIDRPYKGDTRTREPTSLVGTRGETFRMRELFHAAGGKKLRVFGGPIPGNLWVHRARDAFFHGRLLSRRSHQGQWKLIRKKLRRVCSGVPMSAKSAAPTIVMMDCRYGILFAASPAAGLLPTPPAMAGIDGGPC